MGSTTPALQLLNVVPIYFIVVEATALEELALKRRLQGIGFKASILASILKYWL